MRLLLLLLSLAFCSGFTVTDLLIPENAADRQFDVENQILPAFLITFIGALLNNMLNMGESEANGKGISYLLCFWVVPYIDLQLFFVAVLIIGGYGRQITQGPQKMSAEIYIPSDRRSCILPSLPVDRQLSLYLL